MLTEIQGAQLAELWCPGKVTDEQRERYLQELEGRISASSREMGIKMVKYVYGGKEALDDPPKAQRKRFDGASYEI
jgi:hypothetical protein